MYLLSQVSHHCLHEADVGSGNIVVSYHTEHRHWLIFICGGQRILKTGFLAMGQICHIMKSLPVDTFTHQRLRAARASGQSVMMIHWEL